MAKAKIPLLLELHADAVQPGELFAPERHNLPAWLAAPLQAALDDLFDRPAAHCNGDAGGDGLGSPDPIGMVADLSVQLG